MQSLLNLGIVINKLTEGAEGQGLAHPRFGTQADRDPWPALGATQRPAMAVCNVTPSGGACRGDPQHPAFRREGQTRVWLSAI